MPRWNSVRPGAFLIGAASGTLNVGSGWISRCPCGVRSARERTLERFGRVRYYAHVDHLAAEPRKHAVERVTVAVVDLARRERRPDRLQLVAGREECDADLAVHADLAQAQRCDHSQ